MDIDNFFGKVASKSKEIAGSVAKSTTVLVERGKIQVEIMKAQSDLKDAYRLFGEICYCAEKGEVIDEPAKAAAFEKIGETLGRIDELNAAEQEAKERREAEKNAKGDDAEVQKCQNCGADRVGANQFCASCGAKFE